MLENWYMYQSPDSKELIPKLSLGNTGNTKICLMGRYMFVCVAVLHLSPVGLKSQSTIFSQVRMLPGYSQFFRGVTCHAQEPTWQR